MQVIYSFLFGLLLFGDKLSLLSIAGSLLVAVGIVASSTSKAPSSSSKQQVGIDVTLDCDVWVGMRDSAPYTRSAGLNHHQHGDGLC